MMKYRIWKLKQKEKLVVLMIFIGIYMVAHSCLTQWGLVEDTQENTEQTEQIHTKIRPLFLFNYRIKNIFIFVFIHFYLVKLSPPKRLNG